MKNNQAVEGKGKTHPISKFRVVAAIAWLWWALDLVHVVTWCSMRMPIIQILTSEFWEFGNLDSIFRILCVSLCLRVIVFLSTLSSIRFYHSFHPHLHDHEIALLYLSRGLDPRNFSGLRRIESTHRISEKQIY